ncbi:hypothetical protein KKA33_01720 [Patescibacteria group bacterium]|nr:hypothetical protein [Patescibacteria group bacterium]
MRRLSEKPTHQNSTRVLIGLVLLTLSCADVDVVADKPVDTARPSGDAVETRRGASQEGKTGEKTCEERLRKAMELCIDMCRMRNIGAIGEFDKTACDKQCENGTSKYPEKLKGLFQKCGKKPEKSGDQPYHNPRKKRHYRKRVA